MIAERVAAATADHRKREEDLRARIASLSAQLANASQSQARLGSALATLRTEQRALASRGQSTLGEWLFATNGSRETWGVDNERDN
jgi:ABC-type transporter Mla subunit MlaD